MDDITFVPALSLPRPEGRPRLAGEGLRLRAHHGHRRPRRRPGAVPLRDGLPGPRPGDDRRRVERMDAQPGLRRRRATRRASTSRSPMTSTPTASGPAPPVPRVVAEPADQFYGDRVYRCVDPEGPPLDLRHARARRHPRRGRSRHRHAHSGPELGSEPVVRRAARARRRRSAPSPRSPTRCGAARSSCSRSGRTGPVSWPRRSASPRRS